MLSLDRQNAFRRQYQQIRPNYHPSTEVYANLVRQHLQPTSRLLDIGCGRGGLVEQLGHPIAQIVGIDPDPISLQEHRLGIPRAVTLGKLPFPDNCFDIAFASWVLEHWQYPERELAEIGRVLRPNGRFIFITPNKHHPLIRINQLLGSVSTIQDRLVETLYGRAEDDTFPIWYRANSRARLQHAAHKGALSLEKLHEIEDPTYLAFTPQLFRLNVQLEPLIPQRAKLHLVGVLRKGNVG
ncbi:MAG: class I SAM-dependent methyltransferase [Candidatus Promineifilaceae bacterium]